MKNKAYRLKPVLGLIQLYKLTRPSFLTARSVGVLQLFHYQVPHKTSSPMRAAIGRLAVPTPGSTTTT